MKRLEIIHKEINKIDNELELLRNDSSEDNDTQREKLEKRRNSIFVQLMPGL